MILINTHTVSEINYVIDKFGCVDILIKAFASALYPIYSVINHFCDSNVLQCYYKNKVVSYAILSITKGEQVILKKYILFLNQIFVITNIIIQILTNDM